MVFAGSPSDLPAFRAIARFSAFVIPAVAWIRLSKRNGRSRIRVMNNWRPGLTAGILVSIAWIALHFQQRLHVPRTTHAWLNVITLSPIAEELLFRCVVIDFALTKTNAARSVAVSALLFSLIHLPWWWLSGEKSVAEIAKQLLIMFIYGSVFGLLYYRTRSIWSSLIPHSVNNLIAVSIVP